MAQNKARVQVCAIRANLRFAIFERAIVLTFEPKIPHGLVPLAPPDGRTEQPGRGRNFNRP